VPKNHRPVETASIIIAILSGYAIIEKGIKLSEEVFKAWNR
jgi:hypothetical protein